VGIPFVFAAADRYTWLRRPAQATATANFLAGALFQLLTWWLGTNRPHPPQDIEALFHALSKPVLQNARAALSMGSPLRRSP
jgi:hypothetical protein